MSDNTLQSILDQYERERELMLLKIADEHAAGLTIYAADTIKETFYIMQLATRGYVELVSLDHYPDHADLVMVYGATITDAGLKKARELQNQP